MELILDKNGIKTKFGSYMVEKLYNIILNEKIKNTDSNLIESCEEETKYEIEKFIFYKNKKIIKHPYNDISFWFKQNPLEFQKFIFNLDKKYEIKNKNVDIIYENKFIKIITPNCYSSCRKYGYNTKWCITDKKTIFYWLYYTNNNKEKIFYCLPKKNEKKYVVYVYHFHITDKNDKNISVFNFFKILFSYKISIFKLFYLFFKFKCYREVICIKGETK